MYEKKLRRFKQRHTNIVTKKTVSRTQNIPTNEAKYTVEPKKFLYTAKINYYNVWRQL